MDSLVYYVIYSDPKYFVINVSNETRELICARMHANSHARKHTNPHKHTRTHSSGDMVSLIFVTAQKPDIIRMFLCSCLMYDRNVIHSQGILGAFKNDTILNNCWNNIIYNIEYVICHLSHHFSRLDVLC